MFDKKFLRKAVVASVVVGSLTFAPEIFALSSVPAEVKEYNVNGEFVPFVNAFGTIKYRATLDINDLTNQFDAWLDRNSADSSNVVAKKTTVAATLDTDELTDQIYAWLERNSADNSNVVANNNAKTKLHSEAVDELQTYLER